jgi:hypothetical protein
MLARLSLDLAQLRPPAALARCHRMGFSMRTSSYRYTEWAKWDGAHQRADWEVLAGKELYSHGSNVDNNDFDATENVNLANEPSHASTVLQLSVQLHALVASQEPPPH